jgi:hypothetical protein
MVLDWGNLVASGAVVDRYPNFRHFLSQTLREMERDGLLDRKIDPVVPPNPAG